jgi:hypothetical protein
MRTPIALVIASSILGASPSLNEPARATAVEYTVMLALIIAVCIGDVKKSDLPPAQKDRLIHTIEGWKSLPPTKKTQAYIERNSAQIRTHLATASDPKSQAALQKYMTKANPSVGSPAKVTATGDTKPLKGKGGMTPVAVGGNRQLSGGTTTILQKSGGGSNLGTGKK